MTPARLTRRGVLGAGVALAGCGRTPPSAAAQAPAGLRHASLHDGPPPALRDLAPFPMGAAVQARLLEDPGYAALYARQYSQLTPDYELKMETVLQPDGTFDFSPGDRIAAFARAHDQRLHGHNLVWFEQDPQAFHPLDGHPQAFGEALDRYIQAVVGRYRGLARGWDVVNEPIDVEGDALRPSIWSRNLGPEGHMVRAFQSAQAADPQAVLFLNEGGQEIRPKKLDALLRLADRLRGQGAPLGGLGAELHVDADIAPGDIARTLKAMAGTGLMIHVSELDCSVRGYRRLDLRSRAEREAVQVRVYGEAMEAFIGLPSAQRYAFSTWEARDKDTWLRIAPNAGDGTDTPLPFDEAGRPKPAFWAMVDALGERPPGAHLEAPAGARTPP